jgi:ABC-type Zn uptake system ZnuABC Zn-binding protein ZnuA
VIFPLACVLLVFSTPSRFSTPCRGDEPLRVCATSPDLADLARVIGAEEVAVTAFARGPQDPHFLEARPSLVKALSEADFFIQNGFELEVGWAPALWKAARNPRVLPGAEGFADASSVITPLGVPEGIVTRLRGDIHALGNPHFLLDPLMGLRAAALVRDRLGALRPAARERFRARHDAFVAHVHDELVGKALAAKYDVEKLALLHERGKLLAFLETQGDREALGGWLGRVAPHHGVKAVADHDLWPYFARRFGIEVVGFFEPKPGIPPSTRHLGALVEEMKAQGVRVILSVPYFSDRYAEFVAERTGARIARLAHQRGARPGTEDYIRSVDHNVLRLVEAIEGGAP